MRVEPHDSTSLLGARYTLCAFKTAVAVFVCLFGLFRLTHPNLSKTHNSHRYILRTRKNAVTVLVPRYGIEGTLHFSEPGQESSAGVRYDEKTMKLHVRGTELSVFDRIVVQVSVEENLQTTRIKLKLVRPAIEGVSVAPQAVTSSALLEGDAKVCFLYERALGRVVPLTMLRHACERAMACACERAHTHTHAHARAHAHTRTHTGAHTHTTRAHSRCCVARIELQKHAVSDAGGAVSAGGAASTTAASDEAMSVDESDDDTTVPVTAAGSSDAHASSTDSTHKKKKTKRKKGKSSAGGPVSPTKRLRE
jgi:hypothetical protein